MFQGPIKENEDKYYYELYYTLKKGQLKITNLLKRWSPRSQAGKWQGWGVNPSLSPSRACALHNTVAYDDIHKGEGMKELIPFGNSQNIFEISGIKHFQPTRCLFNFEKSIFMELL